MRKCLAGIALLLTLAGSLWAFQRGIRNLFPESDDDTPPADANEKAEFQWARLRYGNVRGGSSMWQMRGAWTVDYPKADRQFLQGLRRLTRVQTRSVEHVADLISDDIFKDPVLYAVEVGHWSLPDEQAKKLREYVDRGGFLMTDDFHGTYEWDIFTASLNKGFGDRPITEIENDDPIFHVVFDLNDRVQVPGLVNYPFTKTYEYDGFEPKWRAIRDEKGRIGLGICFNMDQGDAWEWADHPLYPEKYASQAFRTGINYVVYAMTH